MKKLLFAIPTLGGGGAERVLVNLVNNFDKTKYEVTIFTLFDEGINKQYLNFNIKYISFFKKQFRGNIHLLKLASSKFLYNLMIKEKYDVVISYLEGPTTRIIAGCPHEKTRLIGWVHTKIQSQRELVQSYRSYDELIHTYESLDSIVFVSDTAKQAFEKNFSEITTNKETIYNTIDYSKIISEKNKLVTDVLFDSSKINLVSVGRYTPIKGYKRLLSVINKLIGQGITNVHLYLIGKGEEEQEYIKMIKYYKIEDYVTLLGFKSNPYKYVKNCDLFICSSISEGYSTAVTEALIIGTPVITTLCSGMEELLGYNNEYGVITDNSEEALFNGLKNLLQNKELIKNYKHKAIIRGKMLTSIDNTSSVLKLIDNLLES